MPRFFSGVAGVNVQSLQGNFQIRIPSWGPYNEIRIIVLGSVMGSPYLGKVPSFLHSELHRSCLAHCEAANKVPGIAAERD